MLRSANEKRLAVTGSVFFVRWFQIEEIIGTFTISELSTKRVKKVHEAKLRRGSVIARGQRGMKGKRQEGG